jgi:integrase/recombinase XerC
MTKEEMMATYGAGERTCPICSESLPAHQTWRGARYRFCGQPECAAVVRAKKGGRYIGANERQCHGNECGNFVPEGWYRKRPTYLSCSAECWYRRFLKGNLIRKCACGCGKDVLRPCKRKSATGLVFLSARHQADYITNKYLAETCGVFRGIFDEYIGGFAALHYRNVQYARIKLCPFFQFLTVKGIASLEKVTSKTITEFLAWAAQSGHRSAVHEISPVSVFFKWAICEGHRKAGNPVVGFMHSAPKKRRVPRPLETNDLDLMWELLHEPGHGRLRLAAAIAEESGLRIGEICRLRLDDVNLIRQRLFVALPNKTNCERYAPFAEKTKRYFIEWMTERDSKCVHDYLLHNTRGKPLNAHALHLEFRRALCKTYKGKTTLNETGFDKWSTHRLRHTMASNLVSAGADAATVMSVGGWKSYEAMAGYVRVDAELARRGYDEAMRRAKETKHHSPTRKSLTPSELLQRRRVQPVQDLLTKEAERCV